jgi:hypothetical protein
LSWGGFLYVKKNLSIGGLVAVNEVDGREIEAESTLLGNWTSCRKSRNFSTAGMIQYIREIALRLCDTARKRDIGPALDALLSGLNEELAKLDARDFLPAARSEFVYLRKMLLKANMIYQLDQLHRPVEQMLGILDQYGGEGSRSVIRSFAFIHDAVLRTIVERDYRELSLILFPSGAWKSTVIMAGSILEAILYDLLTIDSQRIGATEAAPRAPKRKDGSVKSILGGEWRLTDLIEVAADLNLLPSEREKSIDQTLRDYRNFVHPRKEIRATHSVSEAEALMAKGALDGLCNFLAGSKR